MEQLSKSVQENIRKSSTIRLQHNLLSAGLNEESVTAMDRQQLIATWAQIVLEGKDKPLEGAPVAINPTGYDPVIEREKLPWERKKFAKEMEMKEELSRRKK